MLATMTEGSAQVKELRKGIGLSTRSSRRARVVDEADPLVEHPAPDDGDRDGHQRIGQEDDGAIDVAAADVGIDQQRQPEREGDADRGAGDDDQGVPQRLPEHLVVQQVLVVVEARGLGRLERRPVLERQDEIPDDRDDAVEQEDQRATARGSTRIAGRAVSCGARTPSAFHAPGRQLPSSPGACHARGASWSADLQVRIRLMSGPGGPRSA